MKIIYIHGLDSDANSTKGILLESYCQQYHPDINVLRPDLNQPPAQVFDQLTTLIATLNNEVEEQDNRMELGLLKTVLVVSSLGGYFSTLISNHTGCPVLLLNPSTQPHITLQRFSVKSTSDIINKGIRLDNQILYTTIGGWKMTDADLQWFAEHQLLSINYPKRVAVLIKKGDELLDPYLATTFYQQQGSAVTLQTGGDHRFTDFGEQLPMVISTLQRLLSI